MKHFFLIIFLSLSCVIHLKGQSCQAQFNYNTSGLTVQFQDSSVAPLGASYFWWFGSGSFSSTLQNPTFTYPASGTYLVNLTVSSGRNCFDSISVNVTVNAPPPRCPISFTYSQLATQNLTIQFNGSATITSQSNIYWRFGDNNTNFNNVLNPTHTYATAGDYVVSMSYIDSLNNCSSFFSDTIQVINPTPPCNANFISLVSNDSVQITNLATNYNTIVYDFGDGNSVSGIENPLHVYASNGRYTICQTVSDTLNNCTSTYCDSVLINKPPPCRAGFTYHQTGDTVYFKSTAISYDSIYYDFGDGSTSNSIDPFHDYQQSGTYVVNQTIFNSITNCTDRFTDTLNINISNSCLANFQIAIDTNKRGTLYLINNSSKLNSHKYLWDWGDGTTSSGRTPTHTYSQNMSYPICLTISDSVLNCSSFYCDTVGLDSNGNILKSAGFELKVLDGSFIGIKESLMPQDFLISPNPFNGIFLLSTAENKTFQFEIYDIHGKRVLMGSLNHQKTIDLRDEVGGIYILRLFDEKNSITKMVIKH